MEGQSNSKVTTNVNNSKENVDFTRASSVVIKWTFDFMFLSLCRCFKEDKFDEFNETLSTFEGISLNPSLKGKPYNEKTMICAFLSRVMHGKQLDIQFEDDGIIPLVSAAKIWSKLECTVEDKSLFKDIVNLLIVQSVGVCLEKGQTSSASTALKWFKNNYEFSQNLGVKLSKIVADMETYHPFLMSVSFSRLRETVQTYLDSYLEKNPSDYLLKEATKVLQSPQGMETSDSSLPDAANTPTRDTEENRNTFLRTKRKLMSTKIIDAWKPDSCMKPSVSLQRISVKERLKSNSSNSWNNTECKRRKAPEKWTADLDGYLKKGVRNHGVGKWSRILMDYDFKGRTAVMLKDRWRVLVKTHLVN